MPKKKKIPLNDPHWAFEICVVFDKESHKKGIKEQQWAPCWCSAVVFRRCVSALNGWGKSFGPCSPSKAVLTESMSVSLQPVILGQLTMGPGGWVGGGRWIRLKVINNLVE